MAIAEKTVNENQHLTPGKGEKIYLPNQSVLLPAFLSVYFSVLTSTSANICLAGPK